MPTTNATLATLPRAGGNGAALVVVVADVLMALFSGANSKAFPKGKAVAADKADDISVWNLYRLHGGFDSVSPEAVATLNKRLAD